MNVIDFVLEQFHSDKIRIEIERNGNTEEYHIDIDRVPRIGSYFYEFNMHKEGMVVKLFMDEKEIYDSSKISYQFAFDNFFPGIGAKDEKRTVKEILTQEEWNKAIIWSGIIDSKKQYIENSFNITIFKNLDEETKNDKES